ncbi:MAG: hypothetical protein WCF84_06155 [Anaerolineae bacterium]
MDIRRIHFLREVLVSEAKRKDIIKYEFSYDNGGGHAPHFFRVTENDLSQARALYAAWGGHRPDGDRCGSVVKGPPSPFIQSRGMRLTREVEP